MNEINTGIEAVSFDFPGMRIEGLRHNTGSRHKILAIHGWLDNANSFVPLMPQIADADIVAIDLPGHGQSSHLPECADYHFADMAYWFFKVTEALGWESFTYMGHSLGACLAPYAAVSHPEAIQQLIMLEATGPLSEAAEKLPDRLRRSFADKSGNHKYRRVTFKSVDEALNLRLLATKMLPASASLIVNRQLNQTTKGYQWSYDQRHRLSSPVYMTEDQVLAVVGEVTCPILTIVSDDGYVVERSNATARLAAMKHNTHHQVPGYHHMHMDDPATSATLINQFLQNC